MADTNAFESETYTGRAVLGVGWSAFSSGARQVLSLASVAVLARLLGPGAYGLMGMAALVINFLVNFRDLGTAAAVIQRKSLTPRMLSTLFWLNLFIGGLLSAVVFSVAGLAASFFRDPLVAPILRALSVSFLLTSSGVVHSALLSREMAFQKIAFSDLGSAVAGYAVAIPCAFFGLGVWSLVLASLATSALSSFLNWYFSGWRPSLVFDSGDLRQIAGFSLNLSGFGFVNYFSRNAGNIVVGRFLGSVPLGHYQMAYNLMLYPIQNISSVIAQVLFPAFSKIQDDNDRFRSAYIRSCMLIGLITFPVMAGTGVLASPFILAVLGPEWEPAIPVLQWLVPVGFVQSVQTSVGQIYMAKGRTDWMFRWSLYTAAISVTALLIGVRYGISGVAAAYCVSYLALIAYPGFAVPFRLIDLPVGHFSRQFVPQLAITSAMSLVCLGWLVLLDAVPVSASWPRLISTAVIGSCVYGAVLLIVRPPALRYLEEVLLQSAAPAVRSTVKFLRLFDRS
jgi:PST family polysaccharide transporter